MAKGKAVGARTVAVRVRVTSQTNLPKPAVSPAAVEVTHQQSPVVSHLQKVSKL